MILKQKFKAPETEVGIRNYYRGIGLSSQFLYVE